MLNALTKALADPSHQVRFAALQAMAVVGTPGEVSAKTGMIRTLEGVATKDVDPSVQLWAHMALMTVKQAITNDHLLPIAKMLRHDDPAVRTQAAQALAMAGPQAKATVGTVAAALNDPDPVVVGNCIIALTRMEASSAVPALRKLANDPTQNDALKKAAADAIEQIQGAGKEKKK
jgi:HEAT repeat protein